MKGRLKNQRGQGLVEFAVIFPIFVGILFAVIDGGLLMGRFNNMNNSAKEGARRAAVGATLTEIVDRVKQQAHGQLDAVPAIGNCGAFDSSTDEICVEWISGPNSEAPGTVGASIRVIVRYNYDTLTPIFTMFGLADDLWNVQVCAVQRQEQSSNPPGANQQPAEDSC